MVMSHQAMAIPGFDFAQSSSQVSLATTYLKIVISRCQNPDMRSVGSLWLRDSMEYLRQSRLSPELLSL